jgi:transposase-like protein
VDPRGHYSNPTSPGAMANQSGVTWPDLINPRVRKTIGVLYDYVFGDSEDSATIRSRRVPPDASRRVYRRLPPEEIEELVAGYVAGATAIALAGKHSIHRTTVLALLERHQVARRGRVLTPDHIERAVSLYTSGRSWTSIAKEFHVNPETVRQALLKTDVAMRRPGRPRPPQEF